jgi:hypothetical protein
MMVVGAEARGQMCACFEVEILEAIEFDEACLVLLFERLSEAARLRFW